MAESVFGRRDGEIPDFYNGNIDLDRRDVFVPPSGQYIQTEYSAGYDPNGNDPKMRDKVNIAIPQVVNGQLVPYDKAVSHFRNTGEHLGIRNRRDDESVDDFYKRTDNQDRLVHERQNEYYNHGEGQKKNPLSSFYDPKWKGAGITLRNELGL